ncbi:tetratricopeptide repeat protein [Methanoculleus taiwanensis]|uniref:tetratricopeptide repeat protein n=1 Tax=Methanoculleus taiwanensis TaxID=1550565 RepID=UPI0013E8D3F1|nr:tetratricopeptide repeat protein [Methanoculleus taiwanensis]
MNATTLKTSLDSIFSLNELGKIILVYFILGILVGFTRLLSKNRIYVRNFVDHTETAPMNGYLNNLLLAEFDRIESLYQNITERQTVISGRRRPVSSFDVFSRSAGSGLTPPQIRSEDFVDALKEPLSESSTVKLGLLEIPLNLLLRMFSQLIFRNFITGTLDMDGEKLLLVVQLSERGRTWIIKVEEPDTLDESDEDNTSQRNRMIKELACRIFTILTPSGSLKWEATEAFNAGLEEYQRAVQSPTEYMIRLKKAEHAFLKATAEDPEFALAHYNLGTIYTQEGKVDAAEIAFGWALHHNPRLAGACYAMAYNHFKRAKLNHSVKEEDGEKKQNPDALLESAVRYCQQAIFLQRCYPEVYDLMGFAKRLLGEHEEAIRNREIAVKQSWNKLCEKERKGHDTSEKGPDLYRHSRTNACHCMRNLAATYLYAMLYAMDQLDVGAKHRHYAAFLLADQLFHQVIALDRYDSSPLLQRGLIYYRRGEERELLNIELARLHEEIQKVGKSLEIPNSPYKNEWADYEKRRVDYEEKRKKLHEIEAGVKRKLVKMEEKKNEQNHLSEEVYAQRRGFDTVKAVLGNKKENYFSSRSKLGEIRQECKTCADSYKDAKNELPAVHRDLDGINERYCSSYSSLLPIFHQELAPTPTWEHLAESSLQYHEVWQRYERLRRHSDSEMWYGLACQSFEAALQMEQENQGYWASLAAVRASLKQNDAANAACEKATSCISSASNTCIEVVLRAYEMVENKQMRDRLKDRREWLQYLPERLKEICPALDRREIVVLGSKMPKDWWKIEFRMPKDEWERGMAFKKCAERCMNEGKHASAARLFSRAIGAFEKNYPGEIRELKLHASHAQALIAMNKHRDAHETLRKAFDLDRTCPCACQTLGDLHFSMSDLDGAIREWNKAAYCDPSDPDTPKRMGIAYLRMVEQSPKCDREALLRKAEVAFSQSIALSEGRLDSEEKNLNAEDNLGKKARAAYWLGRTKLLLNDPPNAIVHLNVARSLNYSPSLISYYLGKAYLMQNDCIMAHTCFDQVIWDLESNGKGDVPLQMQYDDRLFETISGYELLINTYLQKAGASLDHYICQDEALGLINKGMKCINKIDDDVKKLQLNAALLNHKGRIYVRQGEIYDGVKDLEDAVSLYPNANFFIHLAQAYEKQREGTTSLARRRQIAEGIRTCCNHAKALDPDNEHEKEIEDFLRRST